MVIPNLCATDMRISSSESLRPNDAMGAAWSQSLECEAKAALSLARSMSVSAAETILSIIEFTTGPSQAFWMCWKTGSGTDVSDVDFHVSSADIHASSTTLLWEDYYYYYYYYFYYYKISSHIIQVSKNDQARFRPSSCLLIDNNYKYLPENCKSMHSFPK